MIGECERAQIIERTRRGKRHRAPQGSVNLLSGVWISLREEERWGQCLLWLASMGNLRGFSSLQWTRGASSKATIANGLSAKVISELLQRLPPTRTFEAYI